MTRSRRGQPRPVEARRGQPRPVTPRRRRSNSGAESPEAAAAAAENFARPPGSSPDAVVLRFVVPAEMSGVRLDRFVQVRMPRLSRTRAQKIVRACAFRFSGERRRPSDIVRTGEIVYIVREKFEEPITPLHFGVLHEDSALLVVDKPAGLPMHPTATYHKHTLSYLLRETYGQDGGFTPRIAHRLDRETSGAVLCAKTLAAERQLKKAFEKHRVQKSYLAIVRGELETTSGEIDLPLAPVKEGLHVLMEVRPDGLSAFTRYEVIGRAVGHTLLALFPRSGRQHQLRVHLASLGHPIVGDKLYGPEGATTFLEYIDTGLTDDLVQRLGHARQALHAHTLDFEHPESASTFSIAAPLAPDLVELWERLRAVPA